MFDAYENISYLEPIYFKCSFTRFSVVNVNVESGNQGKSNQCCPPVDNKHNAETKDSSHQTDPHGVVPERRSPPYNNRFIY